MNLNLLGINMPFVTFGIVLEGNQKRLKVYGQTDQWQTKCHSQESYEQNMQHPYKNTY
jgi:hypothetical protein